MLCLCGLALLASARSVAGESPRQDTVATSIPILHGSGTTNPSLLFWQVMSTLEKQSLLPIRMSYRAVGSGTGQFEYVGATNPAKNFTSYTHFGAGDIPLMQSDYDKLVENGRQPVHVPIALGAIAFFHNIPGLAEDNVQLNLTACQLAKVFSGTKITSWDDPEIAENNPNLAKYVGSNSNIPVVRRVHGSSSTASITQYLRDACPSEWEEEMVGSVIEWPEDTIPAEGSAGVASVLTNVENAIGYANAAYGHEHGLTEVALLMPYDGSYRTSLESNGFSDTLMPSTLKQSMADVSFINAAPSNADGFRMDDDDAVWPIMTMTYVYVDEDLESLGVSGPLVKAFLQYLLSGEVQGYTDSSYLDSGLLQTLGFDPLPSELRDMAQYAVDNLKLADDVSEWSFEPSGETMKGDGAMPLVFSGKRQDHVNIALENLKSDVENMKQSINTNTEL